MYYPLRLKWKDSGLVLNLPPQKTRFHVPHTLGYRNGYPLPARPTLGVGGHALQANQLSDEALDELATTQPTLTYGRPRREAPVEFIPAHVAFDKKVWMYINHRQLYIWHLWM